MEKELDGCEADEQTTMSRAFDMVRVVEECSTTNRSAMKMSGTVYYGSDTAGRYEGKTKKVLCT